MTERSPQELIDAHKRIKREIEGSYPRILADFNDYVRTDVNCKIGDGFTLAEATDIWFDPSDDVYIIPAGRIFHHGGKTMVECMTAGIWAKDGCEKYQERNPHIRIDFICTAESRIPES